MLQDRYKQNVPIDGGSEVALTVSVVVAGVQCGRRCRLQGQLALCTQRAIMARRGLLSVRVHVCVCRAGIDGQSHPST